MDTIAASPMKFPKSIEDLVNDLKCEQELQEIDRLKALYKYRILDTDPDPEFDRIAELTADTLEAPTALISFIDCDRQWFKSRVGFLDDETRREDSFCHFTIQTVEGMMVIEDATENPLFEANPYVQGEPHYRFYAGASLIDENGEALGTLCILDHHPRKLSERDRSFLKAMADQVMKILDLQVARKKIEALTQPVGDSLNYASRIQRALFRPSKPLSIDVPDHFIYLNPLDKVSGDFHWTKEKDGYLYMAAVDCTGHGVPGAFLSMLGVSFLNELLDEEGELPPGEVLDQLRAHLLRELNGNDPKNGSKDGMDAAMVKIPLSNSQIPNPKSQDDEIEVEFAGAQNPLYVIREGIGEENLEDLTSSQNLSGLPEEGRIHPFRKSSDGIAIKGDRRPIGYHEFDQEHFSTVSLKLRKGDMLYLFSDGFADQFGGEMEKKFRYGPFKDLLVRIHDRDPEDQKAVISAVHEEWKRMSDQEQTDDVLVMGMRL